MSSAPPLNEQNPIDLSEYEDLYIERAAYGKSLENITTALIGQLAQYDGVKIWGLPSDDTTHHVNLVKRKEFINNKAIIQPAMLRNKSVQNRLFKRVPSLLEIKKVVGMTVLTQERRGEYFVELAFRRRNDEKNLRDERVALWEGLADLNGVDDSELDWHRFLKPRLELAYAPEGSVPDTIAADLRTVIQPLLPSVICLAPVVFPPPLKSSAP